MRVTRAQLPCACLLRAVARHHLLQMPRSDGDQGTSQTAESSDKIETIPGQVSKLLSLASARTHLPTRCWHHTLRPAAIPRAPRGDPMPGLRDQARGANAADNSGPPLNGAVLRSKSLGVSGPWLICKYAHFTPLSSHFFYGMLERSNMNRVRESSLQV